MLLIYYAELSLLFFVILNTLMYWSILHEFKHFVMVEIRCIHIWSLTTISTFSLLSNQFSWIVTFFSPPKFKFQFCCIMPVLAVLRRPVRLLSLMFLQHVWTLCTIFWTGIQPYFAITKRPCVNWHWIVVGETFHPQRSNCTTNFFEGLGVQVRLALHINWLVELYHSCTTNFLSDKSF
jgi:hypothetical protein